MKKSIIIEGPNGSFKSTLGNQLAKDLGLPFYHAGPNPGDTGAAVKACMDQRDLLKKGCVLDRCTPISRPIYDHGVIPKIELTIFEHRLAEMMRLATIIFCTGNGKFTNKDYYPKGHYDEIVDKHKKIRSLYVRKMQNIRHLTYDGTNYESILESLK